MLSFNASSVPVIQLALSSKSLSQAELQDAGQNFIRPQLAQVAGSAIPSPYGGKVLQVQVDIDQDKLQAYGLSAEDVVNAIGRQNIVTPVGTEKVGDREYVVALNGSPTRLDEINDMPIRVVNGATVFIRDVAYAHFGAPPQINMVRVDGSNAVLMTILKSGSASTLDVINGVKALLPKLRQTLPGSLKLDTINDQSSFVYSAVNSVIFEGVVAAALTGLMILIFLGSWRSTLIITISIPLAILASVAALSAIGETINVMTLGGLALAVGILVDDATVTIENINWHLEQGKDIELAIMDGARQIVLPATVSLLCICIVFVPMFNLGGVAGYLFRPMAEAVLFALVASYVLSRTLVNTMARYLLADQTVHEEGTAPPADPQSAGALPARLRAPVRGYPRLLSPPVGNGARRAKQIHRRLSRRGRRVVRACPVPGTEFLSADRQYTDQASRARADRDPHRGHGDDLRRRRGRHPADHSARGAGPDGRQHRTAGQRHQFNLQQFRHGRSGGRRYPHHRQSCL